MGDISVRIEQLRDVEQTLLHFDQHRRRVAQLLRGDVLELQRAHHHEDFIAQRAANFTGLCAVGLRCGIDGVEFVDHLRCAIAGVHDVDRGVFCC